MTTLLEQMKSMAGIIEEDIDTERIINAFEAFYKGNKNALTISTADNFCYTDKNGNKEFDSKGGLKLQVGDLPVSLANAKIDQKGLLGLKELVKKSLASKGILNNSNMSGFDSVFASFAEKLKDNMNRAGAAEAKKLKKAN